MYIQYLIFISTNPFCKEAAFSYNILSMIIQNFIGMFHKMVSLDDNYTKITTNMFDIISNSYHHIESIYKV